MTVITVCDILLSLFTKHQVYYKPDVSVRQERGASALGRRERGWKMTVWQRRLEKFKGMTADILFPVESYQENIIISGGGSGDSLRFNERILQNIVAQSRPLIVNQRQTR